MDKVRPYHDKYCIRPQLETILCMDDDLYPNGWFSKQFTITMCRNCGYYDKKFISVSPSVRK